ncbi:hypothetical protein [Pontibacter chitinilyticus]|uniref:hypothetical protein n=1 Tax=Pontibacter chitinilyticus TaxID=2674989 RepID=UPI00321968D5
MTQRTYLYKTGTYFSGGVRVLSWIMLLVGLIYTLEGSMAGWLIIPVAVGFLLTYDMVEFDLQQQTYREGVLLLGLKFGKKQPLPGFEFLFLRRNNYSKLIESRASMTQTRSVKYDGFVKLANGEKLHLLQKSNKEPALQQLTSIAQDLQVELRDLTEM